MSTDPPPGDTAPAPPFSSEELSADFLPGAPNPPLDMQVQLHDVVLAVFTGRACRAVHLHEVCRDDGSLPAAHTAGSAFLDRLSAHSPPAAGGADGGAAGGFQKWQGACVLREWDDAAHAALAAALRAAAEARGLHLRWDERLYSRPTLAGENARVGMRVEFRGQPPEVTPVIYRDPL